MSDKKYLSINVLQAAKGRIKEAIESHSDFYVSFSGGKDSGVLINLVIDVAREMGRLPVKAVFSDLEVIFKETERYTKSIMDLKEVEPYWLCLEELDDNASSIYERYFKFWGENSLHTRDMPTMPYVINKHNIPEWLSRYYISNNVDEWTITKFGEALCDKNNTPNIVNFIGMRTDESYGRLMNIRAMKNRIKKNNHTYKYKEGSPRTWVSLPIYDWTVSDVWHYYAMTGLDYNKVYDSMHRIGIPAHAQRTCSAFGEEQKKTLYYWCVIEPDTWERMCTRVAGANFGKMYNHTNLNSRKVIKPSSITWKEYTMLLLASLPKDARDLFNDKFKIVFNYHKTMYQDKENIPPEVYIQDSKKDVKQVMKNTGLSIKYFISWETLAGAIIRRDFVFKKYGFGYSKKMCDRIEAVFNNWKDI